MLCKYKDSLGEPGKGVHSYRLFGVAIVDVVMTVLVSFLVSFYFRLPFLPLTMLFFLTGILLHRLFCVRTTIDTLLFDFENKTNKNE